MDAHEWKSWSDGNTRKYLIVSRLTWRQILWKCSTDPSATYLRTNSTSHLNWGIHWSPSMTRNANGQTCWQTITTYKNKYEKVKDQIFTITLNLHVANKNLIFFLNQIIVGCCFGKKSAGENTSRICWWKEWQTWKSIKTRDRDCPGRGRWCDSSRI